MTRTGFVVVVACLAIGLSGCGDDDDDGAVDATVDTDAPPGTISAKGIVIDQVTALPIEGMEICLLDIPAVPCVMSNSRGQFDLRGVPSGVKFHITLNRTDYFPQLFLEAARTTDVNYSIISHTRVEVASWHTQLGVVQDPNKGLVTMQVKADRAGSTFAISPMSGSGPGYANLSNDFEPALTATSASGAGGFINVEPGTYSVSVTVPGGQPPCTFAVQGATLGSAEVKSRAGYMSHVGFKCP